jgi:hypothetical protein
MITTTTLTRGSHLGERTNNVPNGLGDLPGRITLLVTRASSRTTDVGLNVGSRTTNLLRSAAELITVRSPVVSVSDVLHDVPHGGGELRVL